MNDSTRRARFAAQLGVAASLAFAATAALADPPTIVTTTTTETTTFTQVPSIAPLPLDPNGQPIDFTVLLDPPADYTDLMQAHWVGFSDRDVARIAKLSHKSGVPFSDIMHQALAGQTLAMQAYRYNIRLYDIWDASDWEPRIAAYKYAYEHTGSREAKFLVAADREEMYRGSPVYETEPTPSTTLAPSTTIAPSSTTSVSPNGTSTTVTPNGTTTVEPNGETTVAPNGPGSTMVTPSPNGSTTVTPSPNP